MKRTLGSDPEMFCMDDKGSVVSAIGKFGGTKSNPRKFSIGYIQEDNVTLEFNTPPASSRSEWVDNHLIMLSDITDLMKEQGLKPYINPIANFSVEYLQSEPAAMEFGCAPAFDAYHPGVVLDSPTPYTTVRCAGGHIHVGQKFLYDQQKYVAVARLATTLQTLFSEKSHDENVRANIYGKLGAMRLKDYGFEWRAPSNTWLKSEARIGWVWDVVNATMDSKLKVPYNLRTYIKDTYGEMPA